MELERGRYDQTWRPAPRDDRTNVLSRILQRYDFPFVWHDEAKSLYSIERIDELQGDYQIELKEAKTDRQDVYRLRLLKWVKTYDIQVENSKKNKREKKDHVSLGSVGFYSQSISHSSTRSDSSS